MSAQEAPPGYEAGIFQLSIRDLPAVSIPVLVAPDGTLLFPLSPILENTRIPARGDSAGYVLAVLDEQRRETTARVDTIARAITRGGERMEADPGRMLIADGDVHLTEDLLGLLLAANVRADFARLELQVDPRIPFPAQIAIETEQRRQLAALRAPAVRPDTPGDEPLPWSSGAGVVHYAVSSGYPDPSGSTVVTIESGIALLGGLAAIGYTAADEDLAIDPRWSVRYERFIPNQEWISFIRAGDVLAEGAFLRSMRGATVTNRPLRRDEFFQDVLVDPEIPPGYEIEVYQGGQLIAYSDRTARDPLRVPVTYGRTDLEVRMIAPSGEVVSSPLLFEVPQTQLRAGAFEYSAGGGACHQQDCTLFYGVADYGFTRWLTLGAGYEWTRDTTASAHVPFGRASLAPRGGWLGDVRVIGDRQTSASVYYRGSAPVTGGLAVDLRSAAVPRVTVLPQTRTRWDVRGEVGIVGHRATMRLGGMEGDGVDRWGAGYARPIRRGVVIGAVEHFVGTPTELSLSAFRLLRWRPLGGSLTGSVRTGMSREGLEALESGASLGWGNAIFANVTTGWARTGGVNLSVSFSRLLSVGQLAGVVTASDGGMRTTLRADGAVAVDPFAAARPAGFTGIGFAGIDAFAFRDLNANGVHDPGEPPAAGITVDAGERSAVSDSSGHARIWGLIPWERTPVRASPNWVEPQWTPLTETLVLRPVAHVFNPVSIPLVGTREFVAFLMPGEGVRTTAGVRFRLIDARSGETREGMTMSDGSIYISAVPVGEYVLELNAEDLAYLRARPLDPVRFRLSADAADEFVFELPPIVVESAVP